MGLWVTNGTAAGTHELTSIKGADPSGLAPSDLTVYDGEVLFRGLDQSGRPQLWVTNGTATGTHELTGISGAATTSVGLDPSGFTLYDGVALFNGIDSSGHSELWKTNGTAAGTTEVNPIAGTQSIGLSPVDLTALNQVSSNSIHFQNTGGQASIWNVTGAILTGGGAVTANPGPSWKAIGTGDFYGEGDGPCRPVRLQSDQARDGRRLEGLRGRPRRRGEVNDRRLAKASRLPDRSLSERIAQVGGDEDRHPGFVDVARAAYDMHARKLGMRVLRQIGLDFAP